ncbi:MAG: polymerase [Polaromonas sp.]|nr:polymerase [Polaromonas sp.]
MSDALDPRQPDTWWLSLLLVLPWLSPYTAGPTPNEWPWLFSAFCAVGLWLFQHRFNARLIAGTWVLAAAVSAVIALAQYFGLAPVLSPWVSQTAPGEAFANLRQRNQFATLTSIGLIALIALIAWRARTAPAKPVPWSASLLVALLALGNAASSSRTGLLQWLLVLALTAWWAWWARADFKSRRGPLMLAVQALLAYGLAVAALPWLLSLVTGLSSDGLFGRLTEQAGCGSRLVLWSNVLTLIGQKPGLGWGWGELDYAHFITLYPGPRFCEILDNAHNLPLQLAVELGVPAALAICLAALWLVWRAKPWRETDTLRQMAWAVLAVIAMHSLLEYPLWYGPFQIAFALCVGLLWASAGHSTQKYQEKQINSGLSQWLRVLIAIIIIATLLTMAVSYHRVSQIYLPPEARMAAYRDDPLKQIQGNWLYRNQARFAELSTTALTPENAAAQYAMARALLHYSPEPRTIEKLIESAVMLGLDDEGVQYLARFRAAFPQEHARWARAQALQNSPPKAIR